ncbi:MogA/MoaB family molybdenum cofactor biosynthesis protein [Halopiger xanaduensis]|uniref:Molybdenum cofactor synthesis domain protein n=1 Tax=Halopiger xanaduensis (strain DSM 18323 / JCM 14033 / SH-6) TaxID=797210 RepID=F8DB02_HALXS|nr:molybdopterin-binding protein [Halopiger xanaduensis]AEH38246.1 molybdenum cofactor synthesis domain protein [Halopiger xanaduensis SH-6]
MSEHESETDAESASEAALEDEESPLGASIVTIAANRSLDDDPAGTAVEEALEGADFDLATREHIAPSHDRVQSTILRMIERDDVDLVVTAGGTSVEPDDVVIEAVETLLDKELTAFSEVFTSLAYEEVGTRVIAARTLAGVAEGKPVFCLPGNAEAARLATEEIILPEAGYLVDLARVEDDETEDDDGPDENGNGNGSPSAGS